MCLRDMFPRSAIPVNSTCNPDFNRFNMSDIIMITRTNPRVSSGICLSVALAVLGLTALSMPFPLRVHAQTAQAQAAQVQAAHPRHARQELPADSVAPVGTLESV